MNIVRDKYTGHVVAVDVVYPYTRTVLVAECGAVNDHSYALSGQENYVIDTAPQVTEVPCIKCRRLLAHRYDIR